jgi:hypothetical protein
MFCGSKEPCGSRFKKLFLQLQQEKMASRSSTDEYDRDFIILFFEG